MKMNISVASLKATGARRKWRAARRLRQRRRQSPSRTTGVEERGVEIDDRDAVEANRQVAVARERTEIGELDIVELGELGQRVHQRRRDGDDHPVG